MSITRERLYEEVWADPITKVSRRYGVSDSYLVRVLKRLNVPRPPAGHWAKISAGRVISRPILPAPQPGDELEWVRDGERERIKRDLPKAPDSAHRRSVWQRQARLSVHPLIVEARSHLENASETDVGHLMPSKKLMADLVVSKAKLESALAFFNELFLLLERRGYRVMLAPRDMQLMRVDFDVRERTKVNASAPQVWRPYRPTVVFIGTVAIGLALFETTTEMDAEWSGARIVRASANTIANHNPIIGSGLKGQFNSGNFSLVAYSPYPNTKWVRKWECIRADRLLGKVRTIARELSNAAGVIEVKVREAELQAEVRRREWAAQQERWRKEELERRQAKAMQESHQQLLEIIDSWALAKRIESFLDEASAQAALLEKHQGEVLMQRISAARDQIGDTAAIKRFMAWRSAKERLGGESGAD